MTEPTHKRPDCTGTFEPNGLDQGQRHFLLRVPLLGLRCNRGVSRQGGRIPRPDEPAEVATHGHDSGPPRLLEA